MVTLLNPTVTVLGRVVHSDPATLDILAGVKAGVKEKRPTLGNA
jgi:hypothetical protein